MVDFSTTVCYTMHMSIITLRNRYGFGGKILIDLFESAAEQRGVGVRSVRFINEYTLDVEFTSVEDHLAWTLIYGSVARVD